VLHCLLFQTASFWDAMSWEIKKIQMKQIIISHYLFFKLSIFSYIGLEIKKKQRTSWTKFLRPFWTKEYYWVPEKKLLLWIGNIESPTYKGLSNKWSFNNHLLHLAWIWVFVGSFKFQWNSFLFQINSEHNYNLLLII
jgi:hypothetical protein